MDACAHRGCTCEEAAYKNANKKFCSQSCADASNASSLADAMCACRHPSCAGTTAKQS